MILVDVWVDIRTGHVEGNRLHVHTSIQTMDMDATPMEMTINGVTYQIPKGYEIKVSSIASLTM